MVNLKVYTPNYGDASNASLLPVEQKFSLDIHHKINLNKFCFLKILNCYYFCKLKLNFKKEDKIGHI